MIATLKLFHLLGVTVWFGAAIALSIVARRADGNQGTLASARTAYLRVVRPGILLALVAGLSLFVMHIDVYKTAGWLHMKILIAFIAAGVSEVMGARLRKASDDESIDASIFSKLGIVALVLLIVNLAAVFFGPQIFGA